MPEFPIKATQHSELGRHRRMETEVTVSSNGRIDAVTKTWTADAWKGFHGSVKVFIKRGDEFLHDTQVHTYGVNGVRVGDPSRTDTWDETIPQSALDNMTEIAIFHSDTAIPTLTPENTGDWLKALQPLIQVVAESAQPV